MNLVFDFKKHYEWIDNLAIVSQLGLTMAGCIVLCFFIGLYLDRWLGTKGIFVTVFIILGVIGGAYTVYQRILKELIYGEKDKRDAENGND